MRPIPPLAALAVLAGCVASAPQVSLPPDATVAATDPDRAAIFNTAYVFATPAAVAGQPQQAALAVANLEYLAATLPNSARWYGMMPTVGIEMARARAEARAALGIAPDAPSQEVINALFAARRALDAGDSAAAQQILSRPVFRKSGPEMLQSLAALPPLPQANIAAAHAQAELYRLDREGRGGGGPGGSGGGGGGGRN